MSIENEGTTPPAAVETTTTSTVGTTASVESTQTPSDWRQALAEEYRSHKSLQNYKSIDDLAKSHLHLEKMLGQKQQGIVGEPAKTVYEPDAYKYQAEEGKPQVAPEIFDKVSAKAAALQIAPAQFQELVNEFLGAESEFMSQSQEAQKAEMLNADKSLKEEWGAHYEEKIEGAHKAFELFATQEIKEQVASFPASVKVGLTKMMAGIFGKIGETSMQKGGVDSGTSAQQQALSRIDAIRKDSSHPFHSGDIDAKAEMTKLYLTAYNTQ